jgi:dihydropyrimidine dehydrogenase (NAD+) subunit PreT
MPISPKLGAEAVAANMAELHPPLTTQEAVIEANRCLFCFDAPCIKACPTGIDVPSFIKKIANGNPTGAARTILTANILGASCARVCPTSVLCEGACVVLDLEGDPVKIGRLQRHATDHVALNRISVLKKPVNRSNRRIAVVGGGPAGLGCAAELAQLGHQAVIFEKKPRAGGLNTYGIAYYKMRPEASLAEVELAKSLGVEFRCGVELGRDVSLAQLEQEFDAVFIGIGLGAGTRLGIPGEHLPGVADAIDFIEQVHTLPLHEVPIGERVAVIGCGNTAIDAVTQARRLGARTVVAIYRRGEEDMSAYDFEYELAKEDGVQFLFHVVPLEIMAGDDGQVSGLRLARTRLDAEGKLAVIPGTKFTEPYDMVIKAVGQEKQVALLRKLLPKLELDKRGAIKYDFASGRTNLPNIFAGGDCANGGREVVNAVAEGKRAARGIHAFLSGQTVSGPIQPSRLGARDGAAGSGFDHPIRVTELEREYEGRQ